MNLYYFQHIFANFLTTIDGEIVAKLFISLFMGLIIGLEREITNKTAGLRTHILVCLGSTVFTILSIHGFNTGHTDVGVIRIQNDPSRIAAQIVTGIGFIGGGAVLHYGVNVIGLTTAATLWITASIGMAVGAGSYFTGGLAALITVVVLVFIRKFENLVLSRIVIKGGRIKISVSCCRDCRDEVLEWFYKEFVNIREISASRIRDKDGDVKLTFIVDIHDKDPVNTLYKKLSGMTTIDSVNIKQIPI